MKLRHLYCFGALLFLVVFSAQAVTVTGYVSGVVDGDTFYLLSDNKPIRVRLAQIDAPEKSQPFGRRSEQALRSMVGKREVTVSWRDVDRYGRPIVQVVADNVDVNAEMVRLGFAWVYQQYAHDPRLQVLEREARKEKRGLWVDSKPVEPWEWRKAHR